MKELAQHVGERAACRHLGVARATMHRREKPVVVPVLRSRVVPRRLDEGERQAILDLAHSEQFADLSVREIYVWAPR